MFCSCIGFRGGDGSREPGGGGLHDTPVHKLLEKLWQLAVCRATSENFGNICNIEELSLLQQCYEFSLDLSLFFPTTMKATY